VRTGRNSKLGHRGELRQPAPNARFRDQSPVGLHRPVACRRIDRIFQGQEQGVAHLVGGVRGVIGVDGGAGCFSTGIRARAGQRHHGRAAGDFRGAAGKDEKIHAERPDVGGDDCGFGIAEPFQRLIR